MEEVESSREKEKEGRRRKGEGPGKQFQPSLQTKRAAKLHEFKKRRIKALKVLFNGDDFLL